MIPAAGQGTRIKDLPFARILPKPMLPLQDKPILEYIVLNMKKMHVSRIVMVVGPQKELITKYFADGREWGISIDYVEQKEPKGIANAISLTRDLIDEPFVVMLGDDVTVASSFDNLQRSFWRRKAWALEAAVKEIDADVLKRTCCLSLDNESRILRIEEKPLNPATSIRGTGIYLFDPIVFDYIDRTPRLPPRQEVEITNTLNLMAKDGRAFAEYLNGVNFNVNTSDDYSAASMYLFRHRFDDRS